MRLTIDEYSKQFKVSKEMINSKLKSKKLDYVIENGITYISTNKKQNNLVKFANEERENSKIYIPLEKQKVTVSTVLSLYQKENQQLKNKIIDLENKIDKLIYEKEQILREEKEHIENIYKSKDIQLHTILKLINQKYIVEQPIKQVLSISKESKKNQNYIELKEYLRSLDIKTNKKKIIKKRFLDSYNDDVRIINQNGKIYLDFSKYDYSDLLN